MEIESQYEYLQSAMAQRQKQRKSPENGDWKAPLPSCLSISSSFETKKISWKWRLKGSTAFLFIHILLFRNKENLLKMEIESSRLQTIPSSITSWSRNKENLLKMEIERSLITPEGKPNALWNKENLLKMEIESAPSVGSKNFGCSVKQRKSPENGDWKHTSTYGVYHGNSEETKKISWKWRLKVKSLGSCAASAISRNKENLLKMEIESGLSSQSRKAFRIEKQRKSPENGDWKTLKQETQGF